MPASVQTWLRRGMVTLGTTALGFLALPAVPARAVAVVANDDSATIGAAQGIASGNVLSNDRGPAGTAASPRNVGVSLISQPSVGSARIGADGRFTFSPGACFVGEVAFRYVIVDQADASNTATATVRVRVSASASGVQARSDSGRVGSTGVVQGNLLANDCGPGPQATPGSVALSLVSGPSKGTVILDASDGTYTYQANEGAAGADSFRYQITSRANPDLSDQATVSITITVAAPPPSGGGGHNGGGGNNGGSGGGSNGGSGGDTGGAGSVVPPGSEEDDGAGGLAAPNRPGQLPATGLSRITSTTVTGGVLVLSGAAFLLMARPRRPLEELPVDAD